MADAAGVMLVYGLGYVGRAFADRAAKAGWNVYATHRAPEPGPGFDGLDATPICLDRAEFHAARADAILITAPPDDEGCPAFRALQAALNPGGQWIAYLSTTGVYGDHQGRWVFESSPLTPLSTEGQRRQVAEGQWQTKGAAVFRLPGIYGPGRSPFDRLRAGQARSIVREGQVFSRVHVDDIVTCLGASIHRPRAGAAYNVCDDEPAPAHVVTAYAAKLIGLPAPPLAPYDPLTLAPQARRFYAESKRVSNALAKAELGWRPDYPTYREGLAAILAAEAGVGAP